MATLLAIVALSLLIIVHEFGHYICAVATGMKVDRFSVFGIGPVIARLGVWRGTEFVISAIPFGAYVHIVGMEADDAPSLAVAEGGRPGEVPQHDPNDPTLYRNRPIWARMLAILGGPLANYLTAMVLGFVALTIVGNEVPLSMRVDNVIEPAAQTAGLLPGDELVKIAGDDVTGRGTQDKILATTGAHKGETVAMVVRREGQEVELQLPLTAEGKIGIQMSPGDVTRETHPVGIAAKTAVLFPIKFSAFQLDALGKWVTGRIEGKMSGPVGIVREIAKSAERGVEAFLEIAIKMSTLLGLFNLLPLPALDGGRFVFLLWEAVTRRRVTPRIEETVHGIGMLALLGLILWVTIRNDLFSHLFG
ncbi:M50 family metallopeptidase [Nannocystis punicea]|uniref:M50 family metallopeptidase n=1 Tax=Nannocystis punicea TaxID=2995304 RepID=A0ABY7H3I4_9BACT|nr:M50 family metallopeptidase [Nannocystis poenicansa]WAS93841.1 M50 family metallopeptidase [Nannocystis poenicansa]